MSPSPDQQQLQPPSKKAKLVDFVPNPAEGEKYPSDDAILEAFLEWVMEAGIEPYEAQEEAFLEICSARHVILNTPTGSGKSLVALCAHFRGLCRGERSFYTSPIKALVSEKFFDLCRAFGAERVGMLTGDAGINHDAAIVCCTAEVLANIGLRDGAQALVEHVIMDEFHYYGDRDRGISWQLPLLTMPQATYLLMSATLGDTARFETEIPEFTGRELAVVRSSTRPVPLEFDWSERPVHEALQELVRRDRAPVYVVNFTQRECAEMAQALTSTKLIERDERESIVAALAGFRFDSVYGKDLERFILAGVGLHHAGLLPKYRLLVEKLAQAGLMKIIVGTDTLGVGVNVPIRSVLFTKLCKYDGESTKILAVRDFKQIAGRAGRKGFDDHGWVVAQAPEHVIENKRLEAKAESSGKKKKFVRKKPPERGYVPWDEKVFRRLIESEPEPLVSSFRVDHGLMLNLLQRENALYKRGGGYKDLLKLIAACHERPAVKSRLKLAAAGLFRSLRSAKVIEIVRVSEIRNNDAKGAVVKVAADLQKEFSLYHTLGLYLVDALETLDEDSPSYPLDLLTFVESILESPRAILEAQERKLKSAKVAELKAGGVEYDQRMEELEKVTYPKPNEELLYDSFNRFAADHPWVAIDNVRPKSIVRDMYEQYITFDQYTKSLGVARIEGVLLRYLNDAYRTLCQTVPAAYKDARVDDMVAWLRSVIDRVDSSLVQEWERMLEPPEDLADDLARADADAQLLAARDISSDTRSFHARIRAEVHTLIAGLATRDYESVAEGLRTRAGDDEAEEAVWSAAGLEAAMVGFYEEHERIVFDHAARQPSQTQIVQLEPGLWEVRQTLRDPELESVWGVFAHVDLRDDRNPSGPLLELERIAV